MLNLEEKAEMSRSTRMRLSWFKPLSIAERRRDMCLSHLATAAMSWSLRNRSMFSMSVSACTTTTASSHICFRQVFMQVGCDLSAESRGKVVKESPST